MKHTLIISTTTCFFRSVREGARSGAGNVSRNERRTTRGEALAGGEDEKCIDPREGWRFRDGVRARTGVILSPGESSV
jgi:hypothetical protein